MTVYSRTGGSNNDSYMDIVLERTIDGANPTVVSSINRRVAVSNWQFHGVDTPNFHARMRAGQLMPMTPFELFRQDGSCTGSYDAYDADASHTYHTYCISDTYVRDGYWAPTYVQMQAFAELADIGYAQEAAAKIYGSGHDTLTFLAELADVQRQFLSVGKRLAGVLPRLPRDWKDLSGRWLAYRYGWRTLVFDLQDLARAISALNEKRTRYSERAGGTFTDSEEWQYDEEDTYRTRHHAYTASVEYGLRGSVVADVEIPQFQFNPLMTGWELIPFSFVVDWFISVGKALAAWSFLSLKPKYVASYGIAVTYVRDYNYYTTWNTTAWGTEESSGFSTTEYKRRIPCKIPYLPHFRVRLNPSKILDMLGMIIQRA